MHTFIEYCAGLISLEMINKLLKCEIMIKDKVKAPAVGLTLYDVVYDNSVYDLHNKVISDVENRYYASKTKFN